MTDFFRNLELPDDVPSAHKARLAHRLFDRGTPHGGPSPGRRPRRFLALSGAGVALAGGLGAALVLSNAGVTPPPANATELLNRAADAARAAVAEAPAPEARVAYQVSEWVSTYQVFCEEGSEPLTVTDRYEIESWYELDGDRVRTVSHAPDGTVTDDSITVGDPWTGDGAYYTRADLFTGTGSGERWTAESTLGDLAVPVGERRQALATLLTFGELLGREPQADGSTLLQIRIVEDLGTPVAGAWVDPCGAEAPADATTSTTDLFIDEELALIIRGEYTTEYADGTHDSYTSDAAVYSAEAVLYNPDAAVEIRATAVEFLAARATELEPGVDADGLTYRRFRLDEAPFEGGDETYARIHWIGDNMLIAASEYGTVDANGNFVRDGISAGVTRAPALLVVEAAAAEFFGDYTGTVLSAPDWAAIGAEVRATGEPTITTDTVLVYRVPVPGAAAVDLAADAYATLPDAATLAVWGDTLAQDVVLDASTGELLGSFGYVTDGTTTAVYEIFGPTIAGTAVDPGETAPSAVLYESLYGGNSPFIDPDDIGARLDIITSLQELDGVELVGEMTDSQGRPALVLQVKEEQLDEFGEVIGFYVDEVLFDASTYQLLEQRWYSTDAAGVPLGDTSRTTVLREELGTDVSVFDTSGYTEVSEFKGE